MGRIFQKKIKISKAFTLAEVLITLGIIGVVASLTIPTLVKNYQKQQTVEKLKKVYTTLSQAVRQSEIENGPNKYWDWGTPGDAASIKQGFNTLWAPYLKINHYCATFSDCGYNSNSPWEGSSMGIIDSANRTSLILSDGTYMMVRTKDGAKGIYIDINAGKKPNKMNIDFFTFVLDENKGFHASGYAAKIITDGWQIKDDYPWN